MGDFKSKWWTSMLKKYGTEEAVREVLREGQKKGRLNYKGTGGFASSKELASRAGKIGAEKRWGNYANKDNASTKTEDNAEG